MEHRHSNLSQLCFVALLVLFNVMTFQVYANEALSSDQPMQKLLSAAETDDAELVQDALNAGAPVDSRDSRGRTALLIATYHNAVNVAKLLIEAGANVDAMDNQRDSPFLYAGAEGRLEILKLTVSAGADLKSLNRYGGTALIPAAHHGHVETVRYLLTTKIDIDHVNDLGWTALMEAVILGDGGPIYQQIVRILLDAGANADIPDRNGVTPLQHAQRAKQDAIVKLLR